MTNSPDQRTDLNLWITIHTDICTAIGRISDQMQQREPMSFEWQELLKSSNRVSEAGKVAYEMICKLAK